jgi:hypothetical protein
MAEPDLTPVYNDIQSHVENTLPKLPYISNPNCSLPPLVGDLLTFDKLPTYDPIIQIAMTGLGEVNTELRNYPLIQDSDQAITVGLNEALSCIVVESDNKFDRVASIIGRMIVTPLFLQGAIATQITSFNESAKNFYTSSIAIKKFTEAHESRNPDERSKAPDNLASEQATILVHQAAIVNSIVTNFHTNKAIFDGFFDILIRAAAAGSAADSTLLSIAYYNAASAASDVSTAASMKIRE